MQQFQPTGFRVLPPVVKNLLIINALLFLATISLNSSLGFDLGDWLSLKYFGASEFKPFQFITYMFMHGSISHLFFNMFALWMFGSVIENYWGTKKFLIFYFFTGVGAAIVHYTVYYFQLSPTLSILDNFLNNPTLENLNSIATNHQFQVNDESGSIWTQFIDFQKYYNQIQLNNHSLISIQPCIDFIQNYREYYLNLPSVVGASGAVFGLLLAFGMLFPNSLIYIYFLFPLKAKWLVIIYGGLELYSGVTGSSDGIAHFAHLGGMIFGIILILIWRKTDKNSYYRHL